jgi:hypothetical protein
VVEDRLNRKVSQKRASELAQDLRQSLLNLHVAPTSAAGSAGAGRLMSLQTTATEYLNREPSCRTQLTQVGEAVQQ